MLTNKKFTNKEVEQQKVDQLLVNFLLVNFLLVNFFVGELLCWWTSLLLNFVVAQLFVGQLPCWWTSCWSTCLLVNFLVAQLPCCSTSCWSTCLLVNNLLRKFWFRDNSIYLFWRKKTKFTKNRHKCSIFWEALILKVPNHSPVMRRSWWADLARVPILLMLRSRWQDQGRGVRLQGAWSSSSSAYHKLRELRGF